MQLGFLLIFLFCFFHGVILASDSPISDAESRHQDSLQIIERSRQLAKFYQLPGGTNIKEVTEDLLNSSLVPDESKLSIRYFGRRVFIFIYPSDWLQVKGILSFVPDSHDFKTIIFLRGGNRTFGILNPAAGLMCAEQYTSISSAYRGGVSEGND